MPRRCSCKSSYSGVASSTSSESELQRQLTFAENERLEDRHHHRLELSLTPLAEHLDNVERSQAAVRAVPGLDDATGKSAEPCCMRPLQPVVVVAVALECRAGAELTRGVPRPIASFDPRMRIVF